MVLDAFWATLFAVIGVVGLYADKQYDFREADPFAVIVVLAGTVPYTWRRRAPLPVLVISATATVLIVALNYPTTVLPLALVLGCYTVAALCDRRHTVFGLALMGVALTYVAIDRPPDLDRLGLVLNSAIYASAFAFGESARSRRLYTAGLEERAVLLERERAEEAARAVAQERLQIARELHDVVAHSLSVIAVQAGVGSHVIATDPEEARRSLDAISTTSRSAMVEMRRILGVLRDSDGVQAGPQHAPAPGLCQLPALVADIDRAGVPVRIDTVGERNGVPPGVDLTAYRIVQEALTNVLKHAGPTARATVHVRYRSGTVDVRVDDDGRGCAVTSEGAESGSGSGNGLVGMRERVAMFGGTVSAGPRPGGGYRVAAHLPYADDGGDHDDDGSDRADR